MQQPDTLQRFLLDDLGIRGAIVRLDESLQSILLQHAYPTEISAFLAETLNVATLLSATLKYHGQLTLQIQAEGPLKLLVVKCNDQLEIRGLAQFTTGYQIADLHDALANGRIIVTIDADDRVKPYQSIVELAGGSVAQAFERYLMQSEQLATRLHCWQHGLQSYGLLLQPLPAYEAAETKIQHDILATQVSLNKLAAQTNEEFLQQLFPAHDIRVFPENSVKFSCPCSQARCEVSIRLLGYDDAIAILQDHPYCVVNCEYCNTEYRFYRDDIMRIFAS